MSNDKVSVRKNKIIKKALLKLNEPFSNDYLEEDSTYKAANFLLENLLENILAFGEFYFNLKPEKPSLSTINDNSKYIYNKPKDYLGIYESNYPIKEIGDYFYCDYNNLEIIYKQNIDLSDIPLQAENYIVLRLAYELAGTINKTELLNKIMKEMEYEKIELESLGAINESDPYSHYNQTREWY